MTEPTPAPGRARRVVVVGVRVVAGVVGVAVALGVVGVVGLAPLPTLRMQPPAVEVAPAAADQTRVCPGGLVRLGEESGEDAGTPVTLGAAEVTADAQGAALQSDPIASGDAGTGGTAPAPRVLRVEAATAEAGALLAGAQVQAVDVRDFVGLSAAGCAEPGSSVWLVGGALTVGRSTVVTLSNPTAVAATVDLAVYGENGPVVAPGLTGIDVPAGSQRVLSLAGFAPGLASPVVHVQARGGQVVAAIQQSIVRGLAAAGVELTGSTPEPATELVIPGVRVLDSIGTNRALALDGWDDVAPIIRILAPGDDAAQVEVAVVPDDPEQEGTSFRLDVPGGAVTDVALDAAQLETGQGLADGTYTVTVVSDVPVVAAVRISTAVDSGVEPTPDAVLEPPASDVAWFVPATELEEDSLAAIADGPAPVLSAHNGTAADVVLVLESDSGPALELRVPAGRSASLEVEPGTVYLLRGAPGLSVVVTLAEPGRLAAYALSPSRPIAGPIVIRPN